MNLRVILIIGAVILVGLIVAVVLHGPSAPAPGTDSTKKLVIGLSLDTLKEPRWVSDRDLFVSKCKELGADVQVQDANSDDARQINDCQSLLTSNVDVLVIVPHNGQAMAKAVEMAHKQNVPVLAYDRIIRDCDLDLYLSFDNVKVGELQAKYLVDHLPSPGKGSIVRIYGAKTDNNAVLFKQGQDNIVKPLIDKGDIKVVHEDWADDWKPERAKQITEAAISNQGGPKFDAILASNDGTAGGAIQALIDQKFAGKILVTGQDADLAACQRIVAGTQTMTVYKPVKKLAERAAVEAVKMAKHQATVASGSVNNGKLDVPAILEQIVAVDKDNMIATVIKDGFQDYDKVYAGVPDNQRPPKP